MKKNVIFRSGSLRMGGLERVLIEVLQTINKEKYNISLIIDDDCGEDNIFEKDIPKEIKYYFLKSQDLIKKTEYYKERRKNIFYKLMYNLYMNLETFIMCRETEKILKEIGEVDVLIDFDAGASKYIEKISAKKKIVWIHNSIPKLKKKKSKIERFGKRLEKYNKIVAICDEMKEELQEIYPKIKEKIIRIYNPFNFERIYSLKDDESELTREQRELLQENYIVAISRLDTVQKDYETLILAFRELKNKGINKKLYIIGDGPSKKEIQELIRKNDMENEILLLGRFKNPYIWLNNSEYFIHSSKYEGFGLVLVEAGILNKMVISSDCPVGPKEILEYGKSGILFKTGDYKDLVNKLIEIEKNKEIKLQYILQMEQSIIRFKKENVIKEIEKLIEKC